MTVLFPSLLVANRGEIARRVMRTARRLGLRTIAVYSDADADAWHVADADEAVHIGGAAARDSYLRAEAIIEAARRTGAAAIHPGYGFLSEKPDFADACAAAGIVFVGPPADAIRAMGLKDAAKDIAERAGVPVVPGYRGADQSPAHLRAEAKRIGYPVLIKAVAGGGGKGMRRVETDADFIAALEGAKREASASFGDDRVLIEKYVTRPRHVEIQVFADAHGNGIHLFERDCSLQRRHQKVIEEAPAPGMPPEMRAAMGEAAVKAALAIGYRGAGTVEFIVDASRGLRPDAFWFMEMNTRLQVEHPVTEAITGLDLVELQLRVAAGEALPPQSALSINGHAVEARLYAEDPARGFLPSIGALARLKLPEAADGVRVDTGVREGDAVTMFYDPMIAKVIAHGRDRNEARQKLARAMEQVEVAGVKTNAAFVARCLRHGEFASGEIDTGFIDRHLGDLVPSADEAAPTIMALAAAALMLKPAAGSSPWDINDGFRIGGGGFDLVEFATGDGVTAVRVERPANGRLRLSIGDTVMDATLRLDGNRLTGHLAGSSVDAWVQHQGHAVTLIRHGATHELALFDPLDVTDDTAEQGSVVLAPMPGKIVQVQVKPGDKVQRGQALVVLEAMKMENTLFAPGEKEIAEVLVQTGDQVSDGAVLIRFAEG